MRKHCVYLLAACGVINSAAWALKPGDPVTPDAAAKSHADEAARSSVMKLMIDFQQATGSGDLEVMAAKIAELEKLDPKHHALPFMKIHLDIAKKDWDGLAQSIQALPDDPSRGGRLSYWAARLDAEPEVSDAALKAMLAKLLKSADASERPKRPMSDVLISRFQWRTGDREAARASANQAVGKADLSEAVIYAAYVNSLDTDKPQTYSEVNAAMMSATRNRKR